MQDRNLSIELGSGADGAISFDLSALQNSVRGLGGYIITSQADAAGTVDGLKRNITDLGTFRAELGAVRSRLDFAANRVSNQASEFIAAESRIRDADVAEEVSKMVRAQVKQQASEKIHN